VFCGYCGTQLWRWDASSRDAERYVCVTVGSLKDGEVEKIYPTSPSPSSSATAQDQVDEETKPKPATERLRGAEWFEDLLGGTGFGATSTTGALGRISRLGVRERSNGGGRVVEWEIVEFSAADDGQMEDLVKGGTSPAKRKIEDALE
jgi:hypothetical protein